MKRFLLFWTILSIILVAPAQERNASNNNTNDHSQTGRETHVTANEARAIGLRFLNANSSQTRGLGELQMATAYRTTQGDTAFYVFNTANGFVMVSADRRATPILGYSDEGAFDENNVPIQMQSYLQGFVEQIAYGIGSPAAVDATTAQQWEQVMSTGHLSNTRSNNAVEPLITAMWDQGCYYNAKCPEDPNGYCGGHVPTGCVATAMGMIMHYWGYPLHGTGSKTHRWGCLNSLGETYPDQYVNFGETTYDWANMPDYLDNNSTQEEIDAVSTLLWHCGVAVEMGYKPLSSSGTNSMVPLAFNNFFCYPDAHLVQIGYANGQWGLDHGINVFDYDAWVNMLKSNLLLRQPVYYSGVSVLAEVGHAWVCDGFDSDDLFHFNWGWGGLNNGYFVLFPTGLSVVPYNEVAQSAVINIHPQCDNSAAFQIIASSNVDTAGSVSGTGTYGCNQICILSAVADTGFVFTNWTENGIVVSSDPIYTFTVCNNRSLVANFMSQNEYIVSVLVSPENGGSVAGGGNYSLGQECTLTAVSDSGYAFSYWTEMGMIVSNDTSYSFTVVSDRNLVAHFSKIDSSGCGIIFRLSHTDGWINTNFTITYDNDSVEYFNIQSSLGMCFFERNIQSGSQVEVCWEFTGDGAMYDNLGFEIRYANGVPIFGCVQCAQDCVSFSVDCNGAYSPHSVSTTTNPSEGGVVEGAGIYETGATCVMRAIPDSGYTFVNWTENDNVVSTEAMYVFNVYHDRNLTATFSLPFEITAFTNSSEYGMISGTGSFIYGQTCVLKATSNEGYCFYYWSEDGEIVSLDTAYSFMVTQNRSLVAIFGSPLNVSAVVDSVEGSVSGEGVYNYNQLCILYATPNNGYSFKRWMENGVLVSRNANLCFNVTSPRNLVAVFEEDVDTIPGLLNGLFSVSPDKQVRFSKGNLQYIGSANEPYWKFAENQYDFLGDNGQCSADENVDRDLFGWGTSGYNHGAVCFQPWSTSLSDSNYSAYGSDMLSLFDKNRQADWGYNAIINGGNETNQWRTLTSSEWDYLINSRNTQSGILCVLANVNDVNGMILLPDNWDSTVYSLSNSRFYDSNIIPYSSWDVLESAGAVFLPACGRREGIEGFYFNYGGEYNAADRAPWPNNTAYREILFFNQYGITVPCMSNPFTGNAVRLVRHQPEQPIYYVTQNGTGGGSSWNDAMGDLQNAIDFAALGQGVVWVAEGTYYGDSLSENAFVIPDGVHVYGGFAGNEPENYDLSLRNLAAHPTILDGQHTQRVVFHDDEWIYSPVPRQSPSIDGFIIQNGFASIGGNVYGGEPKLQMSNCTIQNGVSDGEAGGIYNSSVRNSLINNNTSSYWGSAMQNCDAYNCLITGNDATEYGYTTQWSTLTNCIVWNNIGYPEYGNTITYSAVERQEVWGEGNFMLAYNNDGTSPDSNYVRFVDPDNDDFRLAYGSACINAGTPDISELGLPSVDLQGLPRVLDGRIDMGAYEYYPVPVVETYDTACEGNGFAFFDSICTATGNYVHHTNVVDVTLDTLYVLHLTVSQATFGDTTAVACGNFFWNSTTYAQSGDYTQTFTAANGCDSVVTLHLTITNTDFTDFTDVACDSYTWNGETYTESSTYSQTFTNSAGCDSVVTLHLTVNYSNTGDTTAVACESFTWYGTTYTESGDYTSSSSYWTNATGCDSVVTLHLTINQPVNTTVTETACESFSWNGNTYTQSGDYPLTLTAANGCDSIVTLHLTITNTDHTDFTDVACDSYTWNGETYTQSGDYTQSFTNSAGCDSVVTLHLTINYSNTGDTTAVACENFTWRGTTYTESGSYLSYQTTTAGCDSIVTLHLTINNPVHTAVTEVACGNFFWNDITYTQSGDYTQTFSAANGCDSVVTLHLTITNTAHTDFTDVACDSYTWNGETYTQSGDYMQTFTNSAGCDSIVTLYLTVNNATIGIDEQTACESFTWINGVTYTESTNTPTFTLTNAAGCDSIVTLNLTINSAYHEDLHVSACEEYVWNGETYSASGDYNQTFTAANGCDSIVTLHLTINNPVHTAVTEVACESFTWNGTDYTVSGDYTYNHADANGCTQVDTLHLTIYNPVHTAITETACESFTWNGTDYTVSGDYTYNHADENGCTQVDTLHLTIHFAQSAEFAVTTSDPCYTWNDIDYCTSGDYTQTLQTVHGCDSVVTLHLTITVGVDDYDGFDFKVYPSPTSNVVNVQCTMNNVQFGDMELHLVDAYGRLLDVVRANNYSPLQTVQIDLSRYASGIYFVKAVADGETVAVRKVVKR